MSLRSQLHVHGDSHCPPVERIEVTLARDGRGLSLSYVLTGALDGLRIPSPGAGAFADGLWKHTCFEAFLNNNYVGFAVFVGIAAEYALRD